MNSHVKSADFSMYFRAICISKCSFKKNLALICPKSGFQNYGSQFFETHSSIPDLNFPDLSDLKLIRPESRHNYPDLSELKLNSPESGSQF